MHLSWLHRALILHATAVQVQRLLHLPAPPKPPGLQQQQQHPDKQQSQQDSQSDAFPAAKAGLVSQKQVAEGSDGFIWLDDKQQEKMLLQQQQRRQQQQQQHQQHPQGQPQLSIQAAAGKQTLPCFAGGQVSKGTSKCWPCLQQLLDIICLHSCLCGTSSLVVSSCHAQLCASAAVLGVCMLLWWCPYRVVLCCLRVQVPALWPPNDYEAHWLMTPDNHIAGLDTIPQHVLLDR